jgi:hypothetical protein
MLIAKRGRGPPLCLRALYIVPVFVVLFAYVLFVSSFALGFVATRLMHWRKIERNEKIFLDWFVTLSFFLSASLSLISYLKCVFTSPGTSMCSGSFSYTPVTKLETIEEGCKTSSNNNTKKLYDNFNEKDIESITTETVNGDNAFNDSSTICRRCNLEKPERAHHCAICNYCVLEMDHHCPWTGNCIGKYNYKFFYLFVLYGAIACLIIATNPVPRSSMYLIGYDISTVQFIQFTSILSVGISFALSTFILMHGVLICLNTTTIEIHIYGCRRFPYRFNTIVENIKIKFGTNPMIWFLPISIHGNKMEGNCCNL